MRLVRLSLLILLSPFIFQSCQSPMDERDDKTFILSGMVSEPEDSIATLRFKDTTFETSIQNDSFRFVLELEDMRTGQLRLDGRNEKIFAQGGYDIEIDMSGDTLLYLGSLSPIYIEYQELIEAHVENTLPENYREMYALSQDSFTRLVYAGSESIEADIDSSLSDPFKDWGYILWSEATSNWAYYTLLYPAVHGQFSGDTAFTVPMEYYKEAIREFKIDDVSLLQSPDREVLVKSAVENWVRVDTGYIESDSARLMFMFGIADKMFDQDTMSQIAKYHIVNDQLKYQGFGNAKPLIEDYTKTISDPSKRQDIREMISKWEQLQTGKEAPGFIAQKPDSTKVALQDLRGKVVYLDVWATWCGPCLREIPYLEKMHERFDKEEDLAIVSVSIDADYQKWHDMVNEEEMEGLQLWVKDAWDSELNDRYLIKSIPRFILIDKEGNIVDADAPRPSSEEEIYQLIDKHL